ncbi:MAG: hypothetical protein CMF48_07685 [Legionellales bacterium]|nr:hypothetical protein [Legionellales bacterium]
MKYSIKVIALAALLAQSTSALGDELLSQFRMIHSTPFGVPATSETLDTIENRLPGIPKSKTGKSYLTVNKTGFDVLSSESSNNWVLKAYGDFLSSDNNQTILDVGCGYGRIAHFALAHNQTVIANDIAMEHLIYTRQIAKKNDLTLDKLYLNNAYFPEDISLEDNSLDAVVLYRVMHFMSPDEIELGLSKMHRWLKDEGKIFIVVLSPHHKEYADWYLPIYNAKWEAGDEWPGVGLEVSNALPAQLYNLPAHLHVMDEKPLTKALDKKGFSVVQSGFVDMSRFHSNEGDSSNLGKESFGLIAQKI